MQAGEHFAIKLSELPEGSMREVTIGKLKLLITRIAGRVYAVDGVCPHYGGPLAEGILCGRRVRCPWHQGCFDVTTGHLLEPPPLDNLRRYEARIEKDDVIVRLPEMPSTAAIQRDPADKRAFIIIGVGAAGTSAAQTLREAGYRGKITLISDDPAAWPYDRPALSKNYLVGKPLDHPLPLHPPEYYPQAQIERVHGRVESLNVPQRTVSLVNQTLTFDVLLIAPGAAPRRLNVQGEDLPGVHMLRSLADCDAILADARTAKRVAMIGSGFIGMEAAASLRERGLDVTIITPETVPMASKVGEPIGKMFQSIHESKGVRFRLQSKVSALEGTRRLERIRLENGEAIDADLAIVAVGVRPATDFLKGALPLNDDGSVTVDSNLRVAPNIYAAGEAARFPSRTSGGSIRIEHWRTAEQLGRVAAFNMAGTPRSFDDVPFFWSFQFDVGLDYVGHAEKWDAIHVDGEPMKQNFLAYYVKGDRILAVSGCNRSDQTCAIAEIMRAGKMPPAREVVGHRPNWKDLARGLMA